MPSESTGSEGIFSANISPAGYRFSAPVDGVQVHFCKNERCAAFGPPETLHHVRRTPEMAPEPRDYMRVGANSTTQSKCGVCGSSNPMRSNEAVVEELLRLRARLFGKRVPCCLNDECRNHIVPVTEHGLATTATGKWKWARFRG